MSKVKIRLALEVIEEHFGSEVEQLLTYLIHNGRRTLKDIMQNVELNREEVKKCLLTLIKHNCVDYTQVGAFTHYESRLDTILKRKLFPLYVYYAKLRYGDIAELVMETLLLNGSDTLSRVSQKVSTRLEADNSQNHPDQTVVAQKCRDMVAGRFLVRVKCKNHVKEEKDGEKENAEENEEIETSQMFTLPDGVGKKRKIVDKPGPASKKPKMDGCEEDINDLYEDDGIFWHVNFEMMQRFFIDQRITRAVSERIDPSASKIVATLLKLTEPTRNIRSTSTPSLSIFDIIKKIPSVPRLEEEDVQQYLALLSDEKTGGFLTKTDEAGGGMYSVNIQKCIEMLCESSCSSIILERYGSKACRVFRLLLQKKMLEQKQIGEMAMIPFREVKELLYKLFDESLITVQEVSKTKEYAPSRSFFLFGVDLPQVARLLHNRCYQAIGNLVVRRKSEMTENKRLIEKNEKIEGILAALQGEGGQQVVEELEELITPAEKQQLEKLKRDLNRLEQGEIQVTEATCMLDCYLQYH